MKNHGLADHRKFWRTEFVLAVVAYEEMLHDGLQRGRKSFDGIDGFGNGLEFHHDVAEELTFGGIRDGTVVAKLAEFPDVVENRGRQQKMHVQLRIMRGDLFSQAADRADGVDENDETGVIDPLRALPPT